MTAHTVVYTCQVRLDVHLNYLYINPITCKRSQVGKSWRLLLVQILTKNALNLSWASTLYILP